MLDNVVAAAVAPGDNAKGGEACPPWLFLLDHLDLGRVLCVGSVAGAAWLGRHARSFHPEPLALGLDGHGAAPAFDLVVLGDDATGLLRSDAALRRLRTVLVADGQLWAPADGPADSADRLRAAGFERVLVARRPTATPETAGVACSFPAPRARAARLTTRLPPRLRPPTGRPPQRTLGVLAGGRGAAARPPSWLTELAGEAGVDTGSHRWTLSANGAYPSQKAVVRLFAPGADRPEIIVKVTRDPRFNGRLQNEHAMLTELAAAAPAVAGRAPRPLFSGAAGPLAAVGETAVAGRPFLEASTLTDSCPVAADTAAAITDLGRLTARSIPARLAAEPVAELFERFCRLFAPAAGPRTFLERQVAALAAPAELPGVLLHGDLGTWNVVVQDGRASILDWEAAERPGPPLWDLAYFFRSFVVQVGRRAGGRDRLRILRRHLLDVSPLTAVGAEWMIRYRQAAGVAPELTAPLFHTCWMHRAVKEAARLEPGRRGHYADLCLVLAERHDAPGLRLLLGGPGRG